MNDKLRILVVDDDCNMADTIVDILIFEDYKAEAAHSGAEALYKIKKNRFDCVLTDIKMAGMNGVELCKATKAVQPELTVILMTAYANDELVKKGLQEGVVTTLTKPVDLKLLLSLLSYLTKPGCS